MNVIRCVVLLVVVCGLVTGCGSSNRAPLGQVTGDVTYRGKPLERAKIVFHNPHGRSATGEIVQGIIQDVTTFDVRNDGAPLGTLAVTIHPLSNSTKLKLPPPGQSLPKPPAPPFPLRYADPERSGFQAEIHRGKNKLHFELTD